MSLLDYIKIYREDILRKNREQKRSMFNIKESTLAFFGSCIVQFQMNIISLEQLKSIFKTFGYELINDIGYGCNYFLVRDDNGNEYDIYYNEKLIELMAIYGDESAMKGMSAILDWERDF